jgi:hypothetical protein
MNDVQIEKLKKFANDSVMNETIYGVLLDSFTKPKPHAQVNELAASYIALGLLQDAWREIGKHKVVREGEDKKGSNVGL